MIAIELLMEMLGGSQALSRRASDLRIDFQRSAMGQPCSREGAAGDLQSAD